MARNRAWVVAPEKCDFRKTTKGSKQVRGPAKGKTPAKAIFFSPASSLVNDLNSVEIVKGLWEVQGGTSGTVRSAGEIPDRSDSNQVPYLKRALFVFFILNQVALWFRNVMHPRVVCPTIQILRIPVFPRQ